MVSDLRFTVWGRGLPDSLRLNWAGKGRSLGGMAPWLLRALLGRESSNPKALKEHLPYPTRTYFFVGSL